MVLLLRIFLLLLSISSSLFLSISFILFFRILLNIPSFPRNLFPSSPQFPLPPTQFPLPHILLPKYRYLRPEYRAPLECLIPSPQYLQPCQLQGEDFPSQFQPTGNFTTSPQYQCIQDYQDKNTQHLKKLNVNRSNTNRTFSLSATDLHERFSQSPHYQLSQDIRDVTNEQNTNIRQSDDPKFFPSNQSDIFGKNTHNFTHKRTLENDVLDRNTLQISRRQNQNNWPTSQPSNYSKSNTANKQKFRSNRNMCDHVAQQSLNHDDANSLLSWQTQSTSNIKLERMENENTLKMSSLKERGSILKDTAIVIKQEIYESNNLFEMESLQSKESIRPSSPTQPLKCIKHENEISIGNTCIDDSNSICSSHGIRAQNNTTVLKSPMYMKPKSLWWSTSRSKRNVSQIRNTLESGFKGKNGSFLNPISQDAVQLQHADSKDFLVHEIEIEENFAEENRTKPEKRQRQTLKCIDTLEQNNQKESNEPSCMSLPHVVKAYRTQRPRRYSQLKHSKTLNCDSFNILETEANHSITTAPNVEENGLEIKNLSHPSFDPCSSVPYADPNLQMENTIYQNSSSSIKPDAIHVLEGSLISTVSEIIELNPAKKRGLIGNHILARRQNTIASSKNKDLMLKVTNSVLTTIENSCCTKTTCNEKDDINDENSSDSNSIILNADDTLKSSGNNPNGVNLTDVSDEENADPSL